MQVLRAAPLLEKAMAKLGVTVLVIAPIGGVLGAGAKATIVKRTAATARSIEFDALLVAGGTSVTGDIKQTILLHEVFRQCKAIGAWGEGAAVLQAAGIDVSGPGVLVGAAVDKTFTDSLVLALGLHRVGGTHRPGHGLRGSALSTASSWAVRGRRDRQTSQGPGPRRSGTPDRAANPTRPALSAGTRCW